ncbi:MAG: YicC/YloC family endoribonuclease [Opitutaceae bacterium]
MRSMTGFGRAVRTGADWETIVQASSVNRKSLEVAVSMPRSWQWLEPEVTRRVRQTVQRGRIQVAIECRSVRGAGGITVDEAAIDGVVARLAAYARERGHRFEPDAAFLLQLVLARRDDREGPADDELSDLVSPVLDEALAALVLMRDREGEALAADLSARTEVLRSLTLRIGEFSEATVADHRALLLQRLNQAGLELDVSDERVLKEVALFADRCDITEELTRLGSHLDQFGELCRSQESVGRTMEFLLQEVGREIHTVGSKSNRLEIARLVIDFKNELERIREQVQNVE